MTKTALWITVSWYQGYAWSLCRGDMGNPGTCNWNQLIFQTGFPSSPRFLHTYLPGSLASVIWVSNPCLDFHTPLSLVPSSTIMQVYCWQIQKKQSNVLEEPQVPRGQLPFNSLLSMVVSTATGIPCKVLLGWVSAAAYKIHKAASYFHHQLWQDIKNGI